MYALNFSLEDLQDPQKVEQRLLRFEADLEKEKAWFQASSATASGPELEKHMSATGGITMELHLLLGGLQSVYGNRTNSLVARTCAAKAEAWNLNAAVQELLDEYVHMHPDA